MQLPGYFWLHDEAKHATSPPGMIVKQLIVVDNSIQASAWLTPNKVNSYLHMSAGMPMSSRLFVLLDYVDC